MMNVHPKIYLAFAVMFFFMTFIGVTLWLFPELEPYMFFLGDDHRAVEYIPATFMGYLVFNEMYMMSTKIKELEK